MASGFDTICIPEKLIVPLRHAFNKMRSEATSRRNIEFDIKFEGTIHLLINPCHYCGKPPSNATTRHPEIKYQGLDRIDSNLGYTYENIVPCCKTCNLMKSNTPLETFLNHIDAIWCRTIKGTINK